MFSLAHILSAAQVNRAGSALKFGRQPGALGACLRASPGARPVRLEPLPVRAPLEAAPAPNSWARGDGAQVSRADLTPDWSRLGARVIDLTDQEGGAPFYRSHDKRVPSEACTRDAQHKCLICGPSQLAGDEKGGGARGESELRRHLMTVHELLCN